MSEQTVQKNSEQIVAHLTRIFNRVVSQLERPNRPTNGPANVTYKLQTEFAYIINEIMMQPQAAIQPWIAKANECIDDAMSKVAASKRTKSA